LVVEFGYYVVAVRLLRWCWRRRSGEGRKEGCLELGSLGIVIWELGCAAVVEGGEGGEGANGQMLELGMRSMLVTNLRQVRVALLRWGFRDRVELE
jgi:hypothetical protein